jgi:hypothetical protein
MLRHRIYQLAFRRENLDFFFRRLRLTVWRMNPALESPQCNLRLQIQFRLEILFYQVCKKKIGRIWPGGFFAAIFAGVKSDLVIRVRENIFLLITKGSENHHAYFVTNHYRFILSDSLIES